MKNERIRTWIIDVSVALSVTALMFWITDYYRGPGLWFAKLNGYKWQIDAWLQGHFAISPYPFNLWYEDPIWGEGAQQIWGLGAPLLELPFQLLALLLKIKPGFPERVTFLIIYFIATLIFWRATAVFVHEKRLWKRILYRYPLVCIPLLAVPFLTESMTMFHPYQTTILYGCLSTLAAVAFSIEYLENPMTVKWGIAAFVCGFLALVKITYGIYGAVIFLSLLFIGRKNLNWKKLVVGCTLCLLGPIALLATNKIRFASPFEFGYQLNLSHDIHNDYALRFGSPFKDAPFFAAIKEEVGYLFFVTKTDQKGFDKPNEWFEADVPRFRGEQPFRFRFWHGIILAIAWFVFVCDYKNASRPEKIAGISGLVSFIALFFFYLKAPTICSRYMVDFVPAFALSMIYFYLWLMRANRSRKLPPAAAALLVLVLIGLDVWAGPRRYDSLMELTDSDHYDDSPAVESLRLAGIVKLPEKYACGDFRDPVTKKPTRHFVSYSILGNLGGWDYLESCYVSSMSVMFFENADCYQIEFETVQKRNDYHPGMIVVDRVDMADVQMKSNTKTLKRVSETFDGKIHKMEFCPESPRRSDDNPFGLISIKWVPVKDFLAEPPVKLLGVSKASRP